MGEGAQCGKWANGLFAERSILEQNVSLGDYLGNSGRHAHISSAQDEDFISIENGVAVSIEEKPELIPKPYREQIEQMYPGHAVEMCLKCGRHTLVLVAQAFHHDGRPYPINDCVACGYAGDICRRP